MKNTGPAEKSPLGPPQKKMKQGTVLSFFSATKGLNENASRKRKLSSATDDDVQVVKVLCSSENVEQPPAQDEKCEEKDAPVEKKPEVSIDLENSQSQETPSETKEQTDAEEEKPSEQEMASEQEKSEESSDSKEEEKSEKTEAESEEEEEPESATDEPSSANVSLNMSGCLMMDNDDKDSIMSISDIPITPLKGSPKVRKLTPKQLQRQLESQQRREAKEKEKQEKEQKRKQEIEERRKLKEEEKKQKEQERLEKQQKKQAEIDQKQKEKEAKLEEKRMQEEKKLEEKKKKEIEKLKEKERREEEKVQKELEKKKAEEEEKKKNQKAAAVFATYFKKTKNEQSKPSEESEVLHNNFMPFTLKKGMRLAPTCRYTLQDSEKSTLEENLEAQAAEKSYLQMLKDKLFTPKKSGKTFPASEKSNSEDNEDDVEIIEESVKEEETVGEIVVTSNAQQSIPKTRAKLLQFSENRRPAYWGTWSKKSTLVGPRKPLGIEKMFDYEVDSDEEWEEEEPGESLAGTDDEKESEDEEYEVDNDVFVPHGYLSDEEAGNSDDEALPADEQKERLRRLELEFQEELKKKVKQLTPRMVTCFKPNDPSKKDDAVHNQILHLLGKFAAVVVAEKILTSHNSEQGESVPLEDEPADLNASKTEGSTAKKKKMKVPAEAIPDFIRLLHGNTKNRQYLIKEFIIFWDQKMHPDVDVTSEEEHNRCLITKGNADKVLRELANWEACPEEGLFHGRHCWWVSREMRERHNLLDLPLPNEWNFILKPAARRSKTPKAAAIPKAPEAEPSTPAAESPEPEVTETPPRSAKESLITKFTKVLTPEERQRQIEAEKQRALEKKEAAAAAKPAASSPFGPGSAFFLKPGTSTAPDGTTESTTSPKQADPKKGRRVSLMFSVPRGQAIPSTRPAPAQTPPAFKQVVPCPENKPKDDDDDVAPLN